MKPLLHPKYWLTITTVFSLFILQALGQPAFLKEGLVAYYPFNGNANDESGNGNHGVVNGATLTNDRFGTSNNAFDFDGISNNIKIGKNISLNSDYLSISIWFKKIGRAHV